MALINWIPPIQPTNPWCVHEQRDLGGGLIISRHIDNGISGEILSLLDHEGLKEVGVHSVGQRLTILKEVYHLKVAHDIPIEPEHYIPPCRSPSFRINGLFWWLIGRF